MATRLLHPRISGDNRHIGSRNTWIISRTRDTRPTGRQPRTRGAVIRTERANHLRRISDAFTRCGSEGLALLRAWPSLRLIAIASARTRTVANTGPFSLSRKSLESE